MTAEQEVKQKWPDADMKYCSACGVWHCYAVGNWGRRIIGSGTRNNVWRNASERLNGEI
jgi:hypothetical protein